MLLPRRHENQWSLGDKSLSYDQKYDGGGISFSPFLCRYLKQLNRDVNSCIEVCAGLGFMGLTLLENKLIKNLVLSDINEDVISLVPHKPYIRSNLFDNIDTSFDLIIANLPYYPNTESFLKVGVENKNLVDTLIYLDQDWNLHKKLFEQSFNHLNNNGLLIFFGEANQLASVDYFAQYTDKYLKKDIVNTWLNRKMIVLEKI